MKTKLFILLLCCNLLFFIITAQDQYAYSLQPTKNNPLIIDKANRKVLIYTEINPESFTKRNVHFGIVFKDGKLSDKAILKAYCNHLDFHDALIAIGAKPGNNLTKDSTGKYVEGDELLITVTLSELKKEFSLNEVISDSAGKGFRIKFGGNRNAAEKENTGCITCFESCWVGITSNASYPVTNSFKRLLSPHSYFKGNYAVLPAQDGHPVILTYQLAR